MDTNRRIKFWRERFIKNFDDTITEVPEDFDEVYENITKKFLNEKQKTVLDLYYKFGLTYEQIANKLGLTRERIRQIHNLAIHKINRTKNKNYIIYGKKYDDYKEDIDFDKISIIDLNFSCRLYNCLHRKGIDTLDELINTEPKDLLKIRNFGPNCLNELEEKVYNETGLSYKEKYGII